MISPRVLYILTRSNAILLIVLRIKHISLLSTVSPGADPGFSERGFIYIYKCMGARFADFISFSLNIPWKWNNFVSLRPNYFIFLGYLKTWGAGRGGGGWSEPFERPLWIRHWAHRMHHKCTSVLEPQNNKTNKTAFAQTVQTCHCLRCLFNLLFNLSPTQ